MDRTWNIETALARAKVVDKTSLARFYQTDEPTLSSTTLDWRIHKLLQSGRIVNVGRGRYAPKTKATYFPVLNDRIQSISTFLKKAFPYLDFCIFHTELLASLMQHLPGRHLIIVETERDAMEAVFHSFQDARMTVFLKPDFKTMDRYVLLETEPVIVQPLISEAPILDVNGINTPTIEKILVDLACEKSIYFAYQGAELTYILENAFDRYHIRMDRLLRYADRRKRKQTILSLLSRLEIETI